MHKVRPTGVRVSAGSIAGPSGGGWREVVGESLHVSLLLTVPHSTCRVYSLFIDQCVAVLPTCVARSSPAPRRAAAAAARWPPPQRAKLPCAWRLSAWHSASLRSRGSSACREMDGGLPQPREGRQTAENKRTPATPRSAGARSPAARGGSQRERARAPMERAR